MGSTCGVEKPATGDVSLPVVDHGPGGGGGIRRSRMGPRRAAMLIVVHLLMIAHIAHWLIAGETLSPVEPSEAIYTLRDGHVNAGLIFFAVALLLTLIFGRFVCGWGCHFVAYQDFCAWLLKRVGIKPKPLRSRFLYFAPLGLALYMFVWPLVHRLIYGYDGPLLTNHLMTSEFWKTFPGLFIGVLSVVVCGFAIVYVLGAKGFCTYACPYGGFFAPLDRLAVGRIRVTSACEHCGHCTAVCTSNVRVHEEVATFGMVVDPGCMKCMDCVSVCPNDALYFGFGVPATFARPTSAPKPRTYTWPLWQECLMALVGFASLFVYRGLYGKIPLLMAMGMAGITGYLFVTALQLLRQSNTRLQNLQLKRGGRIQPAGVVCAGVVVTLFAFVVHSAVVRYEQWRGNGMYADLGLSDDVWSPGYDWWAGASEESQELADGAIRRFERVNRLGLTTTPAALSKLVWLYLARMRHDDAEAVALRLIELNPDDANAHYGLGGVLRKVERFDEAEQAYGEALSIDPSFTAARNGLGTLLLMQRRVEEALALYREAFELPEDGDAWRLRATNLLVRLGRVAEAKDVMLRLVAEKPESAEGRYHLGMCYLSLGAFRGAVEHLKEAVRLAPSNALARFNLGVAHHLGGAAGEALPYVEEALRLSPANAQFHAFHAELLTALGDVVGAAAAREEATRLSRGGP